MKKSMRAFLLFVLFAAAASAFSQNALTDNPNHRKSIDLKAQADKAYAAGDFEQAAELAAEAEKLSKTARSEAETERLRFLSYSHLGRAGRRVAFCEKEDAATRYPDAWSAAQVSFAAAKAGFDAKEYEPSIEASRKTIELLSVVLPKPRSGAPAKAAPPAPPVPAGAALPASYVVRLIPERRDCLWRIAEYPFVYGDPWKWKVLYEANKDKLPDPKNPDWLEPGIELTIPSVGGEKREGVWKE